MSDRNARIWACFGLLMTIYLNSIQALHAISRRNRPRALARFSTIDLSPVSSPLRPPTALSPSSIVAWKQCPLLFRLRYIEKRKVPPSPEMARGISAHDALQNLFDLEADQRVEANLHNLFRRSWSKMRATDEYQGLFGGDRDRERAWGLESLGILSNYLALEAPGSLEPALREQRYDLELPGSGDGFGGNVKVLGYLDRLDRETEEENRGGSSAEAAANDDRSREAASDRALLDSEGGEGRGEGGTTQAKGHLVVVDYKTGNAPDIARFPVETQLRILDEKFFQLRVYGLLVGHNTGELPRELRLLFLKSGDDVRMKFDQAAADRTRAEVEGVWSEIAQAAHAGVFEPKTGPLCDWCSFQSECPAGRAASRGKGTSGSWGNASI